MEMRDSRGGWVCDRYMLASDTIVLKQSTVVSADRICRSPFSIRGAMRLYEQKKRHGQRMSQ
jgi:hypothetical protein